MQRVRIANIVSQRRWWEKLSSLITRLLIKQDNVVSEQGWTTGTGQRKRKQIDMDI